MQPAPPLVLELALPAQVRLGDTVPITLRLRNTGRETEQVGLRGRTPVFDILVTAPDGHTVWRRLPRGAMRTAILQLRTLAPGEALEFAAAWSQHNHAGGSVEPGRYAVRGVLESDEVALTSGTRELLIAR